MKIDSKPLRYAHAEGHTDICFTEDGQNIITCGHDGDVRIWMGIEDDDPNSHCVGESALAVCFKDKRLYVATDNHAVQAYTFPAFDKDGIVTRFTAPVTQIMSSSKIEALACSSENMEAKICSPEGGTPLFVMTEHKGPSLSVAICPLMKYACTASGDGVMRIFTYVKQQENMEAKICSPEGGTPLFVMTEHKGPSLSVAICPLMKYACTASGDGVMRIWDVDTQKIVKEINCVPKINTFFAAKVLCRMDFEPTEGKYLAYPNNKEITVLDCESWGQRMTFSHGSIKCAISQCRFSPCGQYLAGSTVAGQIAVWEVDSGACIGIIEHPTSHNVSGLAWNPKGNGVLAYCDVAGQLGTLVNCYGKDSSKHGDAEDADDVEMVERTDDNDDLLDNLIENYESDDDNVISLEKLKSETLGRERERERDDDSRPASRGSAPPALRTAPPQPPFQPSATPTHLEHRYMCWNEVGIVKCHTAENGESSIDVEFHDTSVHHGIHLNNYLNHTMASLSSTVLALACETPSKLVCISLVGSSKEWSVSMTDTEEIVCVAAASGLVACATNARFLRLFTPMGTQRQVISLAGPAVTLTGFNTTVMAVYHSTDPGISDQHLAMDIIAMNGRQVRSKTVPLPLSPASRLSWLGATDAGSPTACDSCGQLRLYDVSSALWLPVCDVMAHAKGASDTPFIVSISEATQTVRAIMCRGASFPLTVPKPIISELPIQVPLCEMDTEKGQYEEQLVRWAHTTADVDVKTARETALKLFALACRSEIEQRALELMELLKDDRLLPLAAKYASRLGRVHLADKLSDLSESWERDNERLNVAQSSHFNELDTQETYDVTATEDLNTSLIIPQRREKKAETVTPIKPVPIKSSPGAARNPFRKQQESAKSVQSPLSLTERTLVEVHSEPGAEENDDPLKKKNGEAYPQWFSRNKTLLEQQSPDLTPSELNRHCIKVFKGLQTSTDGSADSGQKRKLDDARNGDAPVTSVSKQSKLSSFAFQKKAD